MFAPPTVVCALVVHCTDPVTLSTFWQSMLGGRIVSYPDWGVEALRSPGITFDFVAGDGPSPGANRLHLDLATDDPAGAVAQALAAGATLAEDYEVSEEFTVLRDPGGNEFCIMTEAPATGPWALPTKATGSDAAGSDAAGSDAATTPG